jgi:hypothetical protein
VVKISPEWVTAPEQGKSNGRIATFSLWTGMFSKESRFDEFEKRTESALRKPDKRAAIRDP